MLKNLWRELEFGAKPAHRVTSILVKTQDRANAVARFMESLGDDVLNHLRHVL